MASQLVLSLFPGVDLLGRAFSQVGHCVVLGPDLLWDQRIEDFAPPAGHFHGIIGGPPCIHYSDANRHRDTRKGDQLVCEMLRVIEASQPEWWLMENVRNIPDVRLRGWEVQRLDCSDWEFGGRTGRLRHIQFGHREGAIIRPVRTFTRRPVTLVATLTTAPTGPGERFGRRCDRQGFEVLSLPSLTPAARRRVIGNGVPFGMGLALASAVQARSHRTAQDCHCGCGRGVSPPQKYHGPACRQRASRRARGRQRVLSFPPAESL